MVGGFLTSMIWVLFLKEWSYDLYEMIPGFLVGFGLTVGVSLFTEVPEGVEEEFDEVHRALRTADN
jgi:Na+/proline symporter